MKSNRFMTVGALMATVALAGCGGGSGNGSTSEPQPDTGADPDPIDSGTGIDPSPVVTAVAPLNDTGIDWCADNGNTYDIGDAAYKTIQCEAVTNAGFPGQDGHLGRDVAARSGELTKKGGGIAGFDFTKIANNGNDLPASAPLGSLPNDWACTRDNVTGLIWEVKVSGPGELRQKDYTYTWYDPNSPDGEPGVPNSGICEGNVCDTQGFVEEVNDRGLCGENDWRMPTWKELQGIAYLSTNFSQPAIDVDYFPNTPVERFWSATPHARSSSYSWGGDGRRLQDYLRGEAFHVRLVRQ